MAGLLILILGGLYIAITLYVSLAKVKPWWGKVIAVVVFTLIPTADAFYGRFKLEKLCKEEGGLKVYRIADNVEGFYQGRTIPYDVWLVKYGYSFVEGESLAGDAIRKVLDAQGRVVTQHKVILKSRYGVGQENDDLSITFRRNMIFAFDRTTNDKLAVFTNITFRGGWAERLLAGVIAVTPNAGSCRLENWNDALFVTVHASLKPLK